MGNSCDSDLKVDIYFKNPLDGQTVIYQDDSGFYDNAHVIFMYTEGNYSCDCNRSIFMDVDNLDLDCGNTIELLKIV